MFVFEFEVNALLIVIPAQSERELSPFLLAPPPPPPLPLWLKLFIQLTQRPLMGAAVNTTACSQNANAGGEFFTAI